MVIGHRYRITFEDSSIYADAPIVAFIGTYNGIETDINSYFMQRFRKSEWGTNKNIDISSYIRSCAPLLNFTLTNGSRTEVNSNTITSIEDMTDPYMCRIIPAMYDLRSCIEDRIHYIMIKKRQEILKRKELFWKNSARPFVKIIMERIENSHYKDPVEQAWCTRKDFELILKGIDSTIYYDYRS